MPNQAPAQLNHSFTHSFTLNNNNLTLFGFLSYFCCLSLSLARSLSTAARSPPLSTVRRKKEGKGLRMSPSPRERPLRHRQAKPTRRRSSLLQPARLHAQKARVYSQRFAEAGAEWRVGKVEGAKQNTDDGEEKGGERKGPSGSRSRLRRRWLGRCSEGRTRGRGFLEQPKVKAIFPCRRGQCRPRARQGIFSATSSSRRRRGWY